uniref:G-protein coupled receptors family 1 profile domain-containing protein n=1 Tax=Plectus sambesii TaxID=2011161 RepID=A0A914XM35_9BILA
MTYCANDTALFDFSSNATQRLLHGLSTFQQVYAPVHGYICVVICIFGMVTNLVHVIVLTRPAMRSSAVNCILTAVAICDMGTMGSYFVYIVHFVLRKNGESCSPTYTYGWIQFLLWHVVLSIALHTTSLWLAVAMAFIRRMTLRVARLNSKWQQPRNAWRICVVIYALVFLMCIPTMLVHDIIEYEGARWTPPGHCTDRPANYSAAIYTIQVPEVATANGCRLFKLNLWMTGLFFKVIPCILLFFLSIGLMLKLREAERKRRILLMNRPGASPRNRRNPTADRTTVMLVVILLVFLLTELPQGFVAILNAIYTTDVHRYIYFNLGDVLDLLSLINSCVNFVLYCVMSSRYRQTFWTVVLPRSLYRYFFVQTTTSMTGMNNDGATTKTRSGNPLQATTVALNSAPNGIRQHTKQSLKTKLSFLSLRASTRMHANATSSSSVGLDAAARKRSTKREQQYRGMVPKTDVDSDLFQPLHSDSRHEAENSV